MMIFTITVATVHGTVTVLGIVGTVLTHGITLTEADLVMSM
jgi:hypothetical protein